MNSAQLKMVLKKHSAWLKGGAAGERANLSGADLWGADLSGAGLRSADLSGADLRSANLRSADLSGADLSGADLSGANLRSANLSGANLSGAGLRSANLSGADLRSADLDYSSGFSFRCGSFNAKIDVRIAAQMAYHFCRMECADTDVKLAQLALVDLANKFHRVNECGVIKKK